jgi:nucleoside-diphosphate-sugar epimerase
LSAGRVLVTGAGGFIGRCSLSPLIARGFDVHAVLSPRADTQSSFEGASAHRCDLFDSVAVERLMHAVQPSHLLHFAWVATPGEYQRSPDNLRWVEASTGLMRAFKAHGGRRFVAAGTCAEYDWNRVSLCDEVLSPLIDELSTAATPYALAKRQFQGALNEFSTAHDLSWAWGRVFFQFGPHEHADRLVASVIVNLLKGREALCTEGRQVRGFMHVADVGAAFAALLDSDVRGPVNVGAEQGEPVRVLIERVAAKIGRPELIRLGARPSGDEPPLLLARTARLHDEVRWRARFSVDSGLDDTIAWWRRRIS